MIFLPAKIFCQSNGSFHPKDLFAAFHDLAFQGIAQFTFGIPDSSAGNAPWRRCNKQTAAPQTFFKVCGALCCGAILPARSWFGHCPVAADDAPLGNALVRLKAAVGAGFQVALLDGPLGGLGQLRVGYVRKGGQSGRGRAAGAGRPAVFQRSIASSARVWGTATPVGRSWSRMSSVPT